MTEAASSAESGYLLPGPGLFRFQFGVNDQGWGQGYWGAIPPQDGQDLDDFMQQLVAGITGIDPTLIRPRFQDQPPNYPENANWAAVGIMENEPDPGWAYVFHDGANSGRDYVQQHEIFTMLVSFYGPRADYCEGLLRDGLQVSQNREILLLSAMGLVDIGTKTVVPRLIAQRWRRRVDRRYRFHRLLREVYPVLNILSASLQVNMQEQSNRVDTLPVTVKAPSTS
jgi:hypothetical protein